MDFYIDGVRMAGQGLINAVVDNLIDHMMQARAIIGVTDIHAGTFPNGIQAFENLNRFCAIFFGWAGRITNADNP